EWECRHFRRLHGRYFTNRPLRRGRQDPPRDRQVAGRSSGRRPL
ncbi:MAG: hypothetical protein AVDCRST_MAG58-3020, partial [uncultured Rubrobacteraceae bacterium]